MRWQDMQLSLLGRVLLREGMLHMDCEFNDLDLKFTPYNKPYFDNNDVKFNISHSGNIVVCALTKVDEIGIDIEEIHTINIEGFKSQMTDNEWQRIISSENQLTDFFRFWTQKEAVIKSHGQGLTIPLKSFEVQNNETIINSEKFFLKELSFIENYCGHVALNKDISNVEIRIIKIDPLNEPIICD